MNSPSHGRKPGRLVVFSGVVHFVKDGELVAHGGFVREIDIWARIFTRVIVVSPLSKGPIHSDAITYSGSNVEHVSLGREIDTNGFRKLLLLLEGPRWLLVAERVAKPEDCVMARGPDSLGFLGVLVNRTRRIRRFAKYVNQWQPYPNEPLGYKLQKLIYGSRIFNGPVQIYGGPDPRRPHLVPFFTSSLSLQEWERIGSTPHEHHDASIVRLMVAGRLVWTKGVDLVLEAVASLVDAGYNITLDIVGDGPLRSDLEQQSRSLGISSRVTFKGWVGRPELFACYSQADVFIHASRWEGFGKVIIEAMAFSLPIVGTDVGVSRVIVAPPFSGLIVPPNSAARLREGIEQIIGNPVMARRMAECGRQRSRDWVLEALEIRYREFLRSSLNIDC